MSTGTVNPSASWCLASPIMVPTDIQHPSKPNPAVCAKGLHQVKRSVLLLTTHYQPHKKELSSKPGKIALIDAYSVVTLWLTSWSVGFTVGMIQPGRSRLSASRRNETVTPRSSYRSNFVLVWQRSVRSVCDFYKRQQFVNCTLLRFTARLNGFL